MIKKLDFLNQKIVMTYGSDIAQMIRELLTAIDLQAKLKKDCKIGLKPNLVLNRSADSGATTHPEIAEAVIVYLQQYGFRDILILEGSWVGDNTRRAYRDLGWIDLAERYGVDLVDTKQDRFVSLNAQGIKLEISEIALKLDYLINLPVLKGHCQTYVTGALKNMKGIISDREKRRFHQMGLHKPIAYLNTVVPQSLIICDGICGDLDFEEGGNPVPMNRIFCTTDPVLCDSYIAEAMGYEPREIEYLDLAQRLGIGSCDLERAEIVELNQDRKPLAKFRSGRKVSQLARAIEEDQACSACYANLIQALARYDEEAGISPFLRERIKIGQAFKGLAGPGIGCGACTREMSQSIAGCPPTAKQILAYLRNLN